MTKKRQQNQTQKERKEVLRHYLFLCLSAQEEK